MVIKSFTDAAYQAATAVVSIEQAAQYVVNKCPTFVDDQPDDVMAELDKGWILKFNELNPSKYYAVVDKNLVQVDKQSGKQSTKEIGVHFAMSFSQQAFGQLKNDDPLLHGVIKVWRDKWKKYRFNRRADLINAIKGLDDTPRERKAVDAFTKWLSEKVFPDMVKRNKVSHGRGDDTAMPDDVLKRKIAAFNSASEKNVRFLSLASTNRSTICTATSMLRSPSGRTTATASPTICPWRCTLRGSWARCPNGCKRRWRSNPARRRSSASDTAPCAGKRCRGRAGSSRRLCSRPTSQSSRSRARRCRRATAGGCSGRQSSGSASRWRQGRHRARVEREATADNPWGLRVRHHQLRWRGHRRRRHSQE